MTTPDAVAEQITKLARKGASPSLIRVVLRDLHGIAQVKFVTAPLPRTRVLRQLANAALQETRFCASYREIPEDLYMLIKKAVAVRN